MDYPWINNNTEEGTAKQYWPEFLEIIKEMPRTPSGKVQKFKLREMAKSLARNPAYIGPG